MARPQRYHVPGAFYHVMLRGNDGQPIFFSDKERCRMCLLIQEGVERYGHRIHAFCLMGNHIHLLIQVAEIPLSRIIHNLAFRYSQFINKRHKKIGHLFQGRYKAILIDDSTYFLRLLRYIHMNPVRAQMIKEPGEYTWSGHSAYLGNMESTWLTTEHGLAKFADRIGIARSRYQEYLLLKESEDGLKELRKGFNEGQILGDDNFLEKVQNITNKKPEEEVSLDIILKAISQVYSLDTSSLASPLQTKHLSLARGAAAKFAKQNGYSLEELAKTFNRDASSLGRLMKSFIQKCSSCPETKLQNHLLEETILNFAALQA